MSAEDFGFIVDYDIDTSNQIVNISGTMNYFGDRETLEDVKVEFYISNGSYEPICVDSEDFSGEAPAAFYTMHRSYTFIEGLQLIGRYGDAANILTLVIYSGNERIAIPLSRENVVIMSNGKVQTISEAAENASEAAENASEAAESVNAADLWDNCNVFGSSGMLLVLNAFLLLFPFKKRH